MHVVRNLALATAKGSSTSVKHLNINIHELLDVPASLAGGVLGEQSFLISFSSRAAIGQTIQSVSLPKAYPEAHVTARYG